MVSYVDGPEHSPSVGGRLIGGRYLRLRKIGTGSQGDVWECEDIRTSHRVACKSFSPSTRRTKSSVAVLDIYAEMRALQTLGGHPNVVRLIDFFVDATEVHIIMELVQGGDLCTEICENGPLPEPLAATVLRQLASAVAFCHANGVVHRDIKPENVLLVRPVQEKPEDWESEGLDNCHQQQKLQPQQLLDSCPLPLSFITPEARENALLRKGGLRGEQEKSAIMEMALRNRTNIAALLSSTDLVTGQTCADISPNVVPQNLSPLPDLQSPPPHSPAATPKSSPVRPSVFSRFGRLKIQQALAHRLGHVGAGRGIVGVKLADFALSTTVDGGMSGQKHGRGAGTRMYMAPEMKQRGSGRGSGEGRGGEGGGGGRRSGVTDGAHKDVTGGGEGEIGGGKEHFRYYGCKADVWSLGVTLCVILTGLIPVFDQSGCLDLGDPVWRRVSWAAKDLVRKMLQVDPNQRLSSFEVLEHPWLNQRAVRMRDIATRCPNLLSPLLPAPAVKSLRA